MKENDTFKPIKKDKDNPIETYCFNIGTGFNRGKIIGGFYYHQYKDFPDKNKLVILTIDDIEKRKPKTAAAEFWGGEKDKWQNGQKVGKEKIEGWYEEMCWKTIKRAAYDSIAIDSEKIDEHLVRMMQTPDEGDFRNNHDLKVEAEIKDNANRSEISMNDDAPIVVEIITPANNEQIIPQASTSAELVDKLKTQPGF